MSDQKDRSAEWIACTGWWEHPSYGRQPMTPLRMCFQNDSVYGHGMDIIGRFELKGTFYVCARRTAFYSFEQRSRSSCLRSAMVQRCWGWERSQVLGSSDARRAPSGS